LFFEGFDLMQLHGDSHGGKELTVILMTMLPTPLQTEDLFDQALQGLHCFRSLFVQTLIARLRDHKLHRGST
jgi:hypothetical protein